MTASKRPKNDLDIEHLSEHQRDLILRQAAAIRNAQGPGLESRSYGDEFLIHGAGGIVREGSGQGKADWETLNPSMDGQELDGSYVSLPSERGRGRLVAPDRTSDDDFVHQDPIEVSAVNSVDNASVFGDCMQYGPTSHHFPAPPIALPPQDAINNFPNFDGGDSGADVGQWSSFYDPNPSHVMCYSGDLEIQHGNAQTISFHPPATETTLLHSEPTEPTSHHILNTPSTYLDEPSRALGFPISVELYGTSTSNVGHPQELSISEKLSSRGPNEEHRPPSATSDCRSALLDTDSWDEMALTDSQPHVQHKSSNSSDWSLVEPTHSGTQNSPEDLQPICVSWITSKPSRSRHKSSGESSGSGSPAGTHRRRRPFHDDQMREETRQTRKRKACLRCRMQRVRVCCPLLTRGCCSLIYALVQYRYG
jgi:hypothetical protein